MAKLILKQQKFADEHIISGKATNAYKKAYTNVTKDTTENANASRMLRNAKVSAYIKERAESIKNERLMTVEEALLISASIARGQTSEAYSKHYDHLKEKVVKEVTYTVTPTTEERLRSLNHILKVY